MNDMSMQMVARFAEEMPTTLANDVIGYARSVRDALPQIFKEAHLAYRSDLAEQVVFIAGVKKLHALCTSYYWILENSIASLETTGVPALRMGSLAVSRDANFFLALQDLVRSLETILVDYGVQDLMDIRSYSELLQHLNRGR